MNRGFSILELLIAAFLLGLVGMMLVTTLDSTIDVKERVDRISDRYYLSRQALSRMSKEISMAYISRHKNLSDPVVDTQFKGQKDRISFVAFGGFVRKKDAKESDQREISYFVDSSGDEKPKLMRKEKVNPTNDLGKEGTAYEMCPGVTKLGFQYWHDGTKTWKKEWQTEGVAAEKFLPKRVQIEMTVLFGEDREEKFVTETEIWVTAPIKIME